MLGEDWSSVPLCAHATGRRNVCQQEDMVTITLSPWLPLIWNDVHQQPLTEAFCQELFCFLLSIILVINFWAGFCPLMVMSLIPVTVTTSSLPLGIKLISFLLWKQCFAFIPENLVWMLGRSLTGLKMMRKLWWLHVNIWQNFNTDSATRDKEWMDHLSNKIHFSDIHHHSSYWHFSFPMLLWNRHLHRPTCPSMHKFTFRICSGVLRIIYVYDDVLSCEVCMLLFYYCF